MRALVVFGLVAIAPLAQAGGADEAVLREAGVEPTASELTAFLRGLVPTEREQASALEFARRLGGSAVERDGASRKLGLAPAAAVAVLKEAARSNDPEVRRRAGPLLERVIRAIPTAELLAALRLVAERPVPGLTREVLGVAPLCFDRYAVDCAERALAATAGPADRALLVAALEAAGTDERAAAALGLAALGNAEDDTRLRRLLGDPAPRVRVVAARALARRGDPLCLPALARLLEADDPHVRTRAIHALRHIKGGRPLDYDAFDPPAARTRGAGRWTDWIHARPDYEWERSLPHAPVRHGRTLIAFFNGQRVIELDARGTVVWERAFPHSPWVVVGLPSGERIVALFKANTIVRFDRLGREVWRRESLPGSPTSIQPLPDGNLLVACGFQNVVLELRWDGSIEWERELHGKPTGIRRLRDDRTLIALKDRDRLVEADAQGRVHWTLKGLKGPYSASRLPGGNTLVCELDRGRVSEWTPGGRLAWEHADLTWNYRAQRLPSGRTLIAERNGVFEVGPDREKRWIRKATDYLWVCRY